MTTPPGPTPGPYGQQPPAQGGPHPDGYGAYQQPSGPAARPGATPGTPGARPRRRSTGATVLIAIGSFFVVCALVAGVFAAVLFVRTIPTGIVSADGSAGSSALASGTAPGAANLTVQGGDRYDVWSTGPRGTQSSTETDVSVVCGDAKVAVRSPSVTSTFSSGTRSASAVAEFVAPADGTCTVLVAAPAGRRFVVTDAQSFGAFFGSVAGVVILMFVAIGGGIVGIGMLIGGIIWKVVARKR